MSQIEVEKHDHARLRIEPGQGDDADPDGDAHVVAEQIEEPEGADQGKRHGQENDGRLDDGLSVEKDEDEDDQG